MAIEFRGYARRAVLAVALSALAATGAAAQEAGVTDVEADPIRCWWRTDKGAVRVGEPFSLLLTCAVVENESTVVAPDQSRLEPAAMQLPPFEVIGGQRGPDMRRGQRRFFQYDYTLRLISDTAFGSDVKIPSVQINYHLDNRVGGETVRGREQKYDLPSESIRIVSLVPADAADIRDPAYPTFAAIDAIRFRARAWFIAGGALFAGAGLMVLVALVQLVRRGRGDATARRTLLSGGAIAGAVDRELAAIARQAQAGWTPELTGRAAAALRVAGSLALGRRVSQTPAAGAEPHDGQLVIRGGTLRNKRVLVSGSATTEALDREVATGGSAAHRLVLEQLRDALSRFTAAQFGRDQASDDTAFSEALADGRRAVGRLKAENRWIARKLRSMTRRPAAAGVSNRAWSR